MIGIVLGGGLGTRLKPLTDVTNKHLLPVYHKPMIYYPVEFLQSCGITRLILISGKEYAGDFAEILGDGHQFGMDITYKVQEEPLGIAHAISLTKTLVHDENVVVILGDNIFSFSDDEIAKVKDTITNFDGQNGAYVFLKKVHDPERFGVAEIDSNGNIVDIVEKPKQPKSDLAVVGLYLYDKTIFDKIATLKPSARGQYEITDVSNLYLKEKALKHHLMSGDWTDAGTFESLHRASTIAREMHLKHNPSAIE